MAMLGDQKTVESVTDYKDAFDAQFDLIISEKSKGANEDELLKLCQVAFHKLGPLGVELNLAIRKELRISTKKGWFRGKRSIREKMRQVFDTKP